MKFKIISNVNQKEWNEYLQLSDYSTSSRILSLTDNSKDVSTLTYTDAGRVYTIVSGSNGSTHTIPPVSS